jgi:hypothetical protein
MEADEVLAKKLAVEEIRTALQASVEEAARLRIVRNPLPISVTTLTLRPTTRPRNFSSTKTTKRTAGFTRRKKRSERR